MTRRHSLAALNDALFGFGDAVCAPVIEWIASHYLDPLVNELPSGSVIAAEAALKGQRTGRRAWMPWAIRRPSRAPAMYGWEADGARGSIVL